MLSVIKEAFAEYKGKLDPPSSAERKTIEIVEAELEVANALMVEVDEKIVGCVFFRPQGEGIYIDRLAVLPEYRNRGIASAMLKEIECRARATEYKTLTLSVRLALEKQQAYYNRLGFEFQEYGTHEGYTKPTYMKMRKETKEIDEGEK
jgi:ribosomal protein S18 acetylase RimI-like enzyme